MKHIISLMLVVLLLFMFAAGAEGSKSAGLPNPVVTVYDDDAFEDILNIDIDADDLLTRDIEMSIIDNKIGQICFKLENVNGEAVPWTLRFTRDAAFDRKADYFAGIFDDHLSPMEERTVEYQDDPDDPVIQITLFSQAAQDAGIDLYFWNYRGVYFSLSIEGIYSQMQFAEAMDRIFEACLDD